MSWSSAYNARSVWSLLSSAQALGKQESSVRDKKWFNAKEASAFYLPSSRDDSIAWSFSHRLWLIFASVSSSLRLLFPSSVDSFSVLPSQSFADSFSVLHSQSYVDSLSVLHSQSFVDLLSVLRRLSLLPSLIKSYSHCMSGCHFIQLLLRVTHICHQLKILIARNYHLKLQF